MPLGDPRSRACPSAWSINPYRGCRHRCVYCFARQYRAWRDLDAGLDFENKIFVKTNLPEVLRDELQAVVEA